MNILKKPFTDRLHEPVDRRFSRSGIGHKLLILRPMFCYMIFYLICFALIEHWNRLHYTVIHNAVDDLIPFHPVFVIPYLLWFPYVVCGVLFLLLKDEKAYHRLCAALAFGMTIFIFVSVVFPNIHLLRPQTMPDDSIYSKLVSVLYTIDTPTNLTPSIHVFNSLAVVAAFWEWNWKTETGYRYPVPVRAFWRFFITALGLLISLSTMLIKQHSFSDVVIATALFGFTYILIYRFDLLLVETGRRKGPILRPRSARS